MKNLTGQQRTKQILEIVFQAFCILVGVALMAPVLYCVIISFMRESEIVSTDLHLWPEEFYLGNYIAVITQTKIFRFMLNSFIVAFTPVWPAFSPPALRPTPSPSLTSGGRTCCSCWCWGP